MEENLQQVVFSNNYKLPVKINPGTVSYKVLVAFFNDDKVDTIKYEVRMRWIAKDNISYIAIVDRGEKVYINNSEPDLVSEELTAMVSAVLYPLALSVDTTGKCTGICNFPEIRKRWDAKKQEIRKVYTGAWLEKFLRLNDKAFQDKYALFRRVQNDWFISAYFQSLYKSYTEKLMIENRVAVPFFSDPEKLIYQVNQQIDKYIDEKQLIRIEMKGSRSAPPDRPATKNKSAAGGFFHGEFYLESQYNTIQALKLHYTPDTGQKKKAMVIVTGNPVEKPHKPPELPKKKNFMQKLKEILE